MQHVRAFLQSFRKAVLIANPRKCEVRQIGLLSIYQPGLWAHLSHTDVPKTVQTHSLFEHLSCCRFKFEWGKWQQMHTQKQPAEKQPGISPDCSNGNYPCALSIWYCCILLTAASSWMFLKKKINDCSCEHGVNSHVLLQMLCTQWLWSF